MTNDMNNTDKLSVLIEEARIFGIEVLAPDVNESQVVFAPARQGAVIRFGLAAIKGVGQVAVQAILEARNLAGKFASLDDLCQRVDGRTVNRKVLEALIKCGACDCFGQTRATMFSKIDRVLTRAASILADRQRGQNTLFGMLEEKAEMKNEPEKQLPEWPQHELLAYEKELLGFYVTGHPLTPFAGILDKFALHKTSELAQLPNRTMTRVGGLISVLQNGISKKSGKPYAMLTLEDLQGSVQVLCMNDNFDKHRDLFIPNKAILVVGEVNNGEDKPKIFPQEIMPLEQAPIKYTRQVHLRLNTAHLTPQSFDLIRDLVAAHPGRCPVFLCLKKSDGEMIFVEAHEKFSVNPSSDFQTVVDEKFGEGTFYAKVDTSVPEREKRQWERKVNGAEE
jgi:DNA polymerase-3 subunit alpha